MTLILCLMWMPLFVLAQNNTISAPAKLTHHTDRPPRKQTNTIPVSLSLACNVDGIRKNYTVTEWKNLPISERIKCDKLGLIIKSGNEIFLFSLNPLPNWSNWEVAKARSGGQMPSKAQWQIVKQNKNRIQDALTLFGGGFLLGRRWWNSGEKPSWTNMFYDGTEYDKASPLKDEAGVWLATDDINGGFSFKEIESPEFDKFDYIGNSSEWDENSWRIVSYNGKYGFIDKTNQVVVPLKYDDVYCGDKKGMYMNDWSEGDLMSVCLNNKWGYINRSNEIVVPILFDKVEGKYLSSRYIDPGNNRVVKDGKYGTVNYNGDIVIPLRYDILEDDYEKELLFAKYDGKYGYIDRTNNLIIPFKYDFTSGFNKESNYAVVGLNGKYGFIDKNGEIKISLKYDFAQPFYNGLAAVVRNDKVGYIDAIGNIIIPFEFDVSYTSDQYDKEFKLSRKSLFITYDLKYGGVGLVMQNGKFGMINRKGEKLTPFKYDAVNSVGGEGDFTVSIDNRKMYLDKGGNEYSSEKERSEKSDSLLAVQGYPYEQFKMGRHLYQAKKYADAYTWIKKSAEGGDDDGQCHLGYYYFYGYSPVSKSYDKAYDWFLKAAQQENRDACYFVGRMLEHDYSRWGIKPNKQKAIEWYRKSNGSRDAKKRIEILSK